MDLNDVVKKINTKVSLEVPGQPVWNDLFVVSVRFSEQNVYYNLVHVINAEKEQYFTMEEIDSKFVKTKVKELITIE